MWWRLGAVPSLSRARPPSWGARAPLFYLKASASSLLGRLGDCSNRPLLHDLDPKGAWRGSRALLAERASAYETAAIAVETERRTVEAVAEEILRRLDPAKPGHEGDVEKGVAFERRSKLERGASCEP